MFVHVVHFCFVPIPPLRFAWQAGYVASCTRKEDGIDFEWLGFFPTFTGGGCFHDFMDRKFPVFSRACCCGCGFFFVLVLRVRGVECFERLVSDCTDVLLCVPDWVH